MGPCSGCTANLTKCGWHDRSARFEDCENALGIESQLRHKEHAEVIRTLYQGARSHIRLVQVKALAMLFHLYGIDLRMIAKFLHWGFRSLKRYVRRLRRDGPEKFLRCNKKVLGKTADPRFREMLFSILHSPPSEFGFNRTTWTQRLLSRAMTEKDTRHQQTRSQ